MSSLRPSFFAKILLFGEYGIIKDAMALTIPYKDYQGTFAFPPAHPTEAQNASNAALRLFWVHLHSLTDADVPMARLRLEDFQTDLEGGLYFESTIPQGFGVGSSGALVAAVYDRYALDPILPDEDLSKEKIVLLKAQLAQMESYFHGKSSGIDPTICYLQLPLLIRSKDDVGTVVLPEEAEEAKGAIFLINSGMPGETRPLVSFFMEKLKDEGFRNIMRYQFKKYNDRCIQAFLKNEPTSLFDNLKQLSRLVLEHFSAMIPVHYQGLWQKGIDTNAYYLKLCGSGGGGYILGFAPNYEEALPYLREHHPEVIFRL